MDKEKKMENGESCCGGRGKRCCCGGMVVAAIVLLLLGGVIGYLIGGRCGFHKMAMGCPYSATMPAPTR